MRRIYIVFVFFVLCGACKKETKVTLNEGEWIGELSVMDNEILPFNFEVSKVGPQEYHIKIINGDEIIEVDEVQVINDSIIIRTPVFEGYIAGKFSSNTIKGEFIKESLNRVVPFTAKHGVTERFVETEPSSINVSGNWEVVFNPEGETERYIAKGIFEQTGKKVKGTFRTTTGDYRYLEGVVDVDTLKLSVFDGAHAFLFKAKVTDSTLYGAFYSGNHSKELFIGKRNENYTLPDANSLTFLKPGFTNFNFSFPNESGKIVSLHDPQFKDKVVVVQIMGTWCPNCLDETRFYVKYLKENQKKDIEFVALAFEYAKTKEKAFASIQRLKDRTAVPYPVLLVQYGSSNKKEAQEKLPMLNHVLSYPTSIFIDKKGQVRKIHTGFNGPATGEKHTVFKKEFYAFVDSLLIE